jgi:hypothetical protein
MANYSDYVKAAKNLTDDQALKIIEGIDALCNWEFFDDQFGWTRIRDVRHAVIEMMDKRHPAVTCHDTKKPDHFAAIRQMRGRW